MILRLAIEQARSQRRYTLWTAALLSSTLGLVSFALTTLSTEMAFDDLTSHANAADRDFSGYATTVVGDVPEFWDSSMADSIHSTLEIDQALAYAAIGGSDVIAVRYTWLDLTTDYLERQDFAIREDTLVWTVKGDYDWDFVLAEGQAPRQTEIVLSAAVAEELGVTIGDTITVAPNTHEVRVRTDQGIYSPVVNLTISGLLRSNSGLTVGAPWETDAIVSWKLSNDALGLFTRTTSQVGDPEETRRMWVGPETWVSYNVGNPALSIFTDPELWPIPTSPPRFVPIVLTAAGVLLLSALGGAFAVGRSLGQARVRWVATARTLGATRRAIRGASLLETLLVGVAATAVGFLVGFVISAIRLQVLRDRVPYPLAPTTVPLPWWVFAGVGGTGLVVALVLAAVPAFWASRVPPIAAHKATADLAVVETSRQVPIRWLGIPLALGVGLILAGGDGTQRGTVLLGCGGIVAAPIAFAFLIEGLRHLVRTVGRRLSRSRAIWVMVAGDAISARPRQASTLAVLAATVGLFGVFALTVWMFWQRAMYLEWGGGVEETWSGYIGGPLGGWDGQAFLTAMGFLLVFQAICLAVTLSSLRVTSAEQATRQAMGLTPRSGRAAAFAQHAVPQVVGGVVGGAVGYGVALFLHFGTNMNWATPQPGGITDPGAVTDYLPAFGYSIVSSLAFAALGLAITGAGAVFASRARKERSPVEALRPMG